jgi:hypothetical protein
MQRLYMVRSTVFDSNKNRYSHQSTASTPHFPLRHNQHWTRGKINHTGGNTVSRPLFSQA